MPYAAMPNAICYIQQCQMLPYTVYIQTDFEKQMRQKQQNINHVDHGQLLGAT